MNLHTRIIESELCVQRIQFRFPRSKKKRIRAKWAKREENVRYKPTAYLAPENTIYCHPKVARQLRSQLSGFPSAAVSSF
jgi:hypothetical protein